MPEDEKNKKEEIKIELEEVELADGTKIKVLKEEAFNGYQEGITKTKTEQDAANKVLADDLAKEKAKDKNFSALRNKKLSDLTAEQKAELSEEKHEIMALREQYDTDREKDTKAKAASWKVEAFKSLGVVDGEGNVLDEDAHKRLDSAFSRFNDPEDSAEAVLRKAKSAWSLEFGNPPSTGERTIGSVVPFGGTGSSPVKSKELNENQVALAGFLGINLGEDK